MIQCSDGHEAGEERVINIPSDATEYEFKMGPNREWVYGTSVLGGQVFDVWVVSTNEGGSRREVRHLVPEEQK